MLTSEAAMPSTPPIPPASLTLREILADPALAAARPSVIAGWEHLDNELRWVHTSEVLDVADLLTGGELILVAGVILADTDDDALRAYIDSLADVGAAGLAVEGPRLDGMPTALAEQAAARGFPLIELHEVVRFVDVTRAINSRLVATSVRELHFNDEVTHRLAGVLAAEGDLDAMVAALRDLTGCSIIIRSVAGAVIAPATSADARPRGYARVAPIDSAGVTIASLEVLPRAGVDLQMIAAACRRAPEPLALALLRDNPMTLSDQHVREVFRLLVSAADPERSGAVRSEDARAMRTATTELGFDGPALFVGVVALSVSGPLQTAELSEALRIDEFPVLSEVRDGIHRSIVRVPTRRDRGVVVDDLVRRLMSWALPGQLRIGVTEPADDILALAPEMAMARTAASSAISRDYVALARDVAVDHFLSGVDARVVDGFLQSVLGPILASDRCDEFLLTLVALHRTGSRVAAAKELNIHRQTMYQRLDRITRILGRPIDDNSGAKGALLVAAELALARGQG